MFHVHTPEPTTGTTTFLDVEFHDGVAHVEDLHPVRELALIQHGYRVEHELVGETLESQTVPQLRKLAEGEGIDLPPKAKKAEIIEALNAVPVRELTAGDVAADANASGEVNSGVLAPGTLEAWADGGVHVPAPSSVEPVEGGEAYIPGPRPKE